jgi:hypothetical protein
MFKNIVIQNALVFVAQIQNPHPNQYIIPQKEINLTVGDTEIEGAPGPKGNLGLPTRVRQSHLRINI